MQKPILSFLKAAVALAVAAEADSNQSLSAIPPASSATNFSSAVLETGPVAYWRLNEAAGTKTKDWAGRHDGTNHNVLLGASGMVSPPTFGPPPNNLPYGFDGASSYVQTPLSIAGNQGTFMALVKPNDIQSSAAAVCIGRGSGLSVCALCMQNDGADMQYVWANDSGTWDFDPGFAPPPNQWTFVAVSVSPSNVVMYMDAGHGLMAATNLHTHGLVSEAGPITIGGDPLFNNQRFFNGGIAEVAVFNRALTRAEIAGIVRYACCTNLTPTINPSRVAFAPVHYRPMAAKVSGLNQSTRSLDGAWRIDPKPRLNPRETPLDAVNWRNFHVPGQWELQGYDIPRDHTAALAREFTIPANWAGYRIFLRFDAIHGGTHYWLNGQPLGYSENLFTPVEWEITDAAKVGQTNRLDLEMKVATALERLSCSSDYTCTGSSVKHSLGGIDRAVRIYALPKVQVATLHLNAGLNKAYRDGQLQIELGLENPEPSIQNGLALSIQLFDARGKTVAHSIPTLALEPLKPGASTVSLESRVENPLKWNAEQPNLYQLVLALKKDGQTLEQIERHIGFRTIETRDRQLYVNGVRVKLAGVCHHEIDPLTGRADTMRHAEEDVKSFKRANLNHVRTSHYPCTQEFLDAADQYGLYVESEAPFCWVARAKDMKDLNAILTPTSAMIDYNHSHPSVILWSLANESQWSGLFAESAKLCKQLDPTRPTTLEDARPAKAQVTFDILNRHYQDLPYDEIFEDDPRPFLHGECFFLVYHERTDVAIDPGLRELWAHGSADPTSDWGKTCIQNLAAKQHMTPGIYPGAWNYIYASKRCIGSEIWSGVDDIVFLPDGKIGSSENGNAYWGLVDGWRRPKPELYLSKFVFSPVWFPVRQLDFHSGQHSVRVPVENRYSFTDLNKFDFIWELAGAKGKTDLNLAPASKGELEIPIRKDTPEGSLLLVRVVNGGNEIINATLSLGKRNPASLPQPQAGAPKWTDNGKLITLQGKGFSLVLNRVTGDFDAANPKHQAPVISFPALHVTRHDFGDLAKKKAPYAEFPDAKTRVIESVTATERGNGLEVTVKDHYEHFSGTVRWLIDKNGTGKVSYDYTYSGPDLDTREIGLKALLRADYDEVRWQRWSEWGVFPKDSISRTEGRAKAHRDKKWPAQPANVRPSWPWSQDETELGTADFRAIKFNIYHASLLARDRSGVEVNANADVHFRACLATNGVKMHILSQCPLAQVVLKDGARLAGEYTVRFLP